MASMRSSTDEGAGFQGVQVCIKPFMRCEYGPPSHVRPGGQSAVVLQRILPLPPQVVSVAQPDVGPIGIGICGAQQ